MIKTISVVNYLEERLDLELTAPEKSGLYVQSVTGIGAGKASISTTDLASDDGGVFNSARAEVRNIVLNLGMYDTLIGNPGWSIEDARQLTYKFFPKKKELTLFFETDNRTLFINGFVESNEPDIFSEQESTQISIICPDPNFYDVDTNTSWMGGIISKFEFPFENDTVGEDVTLHGGIPKEDQTILSTLPIEGEEGHYYFVRTNESRRFIEYVYLGGSYYQLNDNKIIDTAELEFSELNDHAEYIVDYDGEVDIGIIITIHFIGPASNIIIYNVDIQRSMSIDTSKIESIEEIGAIRSGDDIIISTVNGSKYCIFKRNDNEFNILNSIIRNDPEWFKLKKGTNTFMFSAETGRDNLKISIENLVAYEGV